MSDSEDDFASADEGEVDTASKQSKSSQDSTAATASAPAKTDDQEVSKVEAQKETSKKSDTKQGKKKGKASGKGSGGGKVVTKTDTNQIEATAKSKAESQQGARGKGKKGKQKGASSDNKEVKKDCEVEKIKPEVQAKTDESDAAKLTESKKEEPEIVNSEVKLENKEKSNQSEEKISVPDTENEQVEKIENIVQDTSKDAETDVTKTPTKDGVVSDSNKDTMKHTLSVESSTIIKSPSSQSITRPEPDHTNEQENVLDKLADVGAEKKQSGWGWGWGSSLLDVASTSVSTFTHQVGEGFSTVMETVESTLNVPSPEELVQQSEEKADKDGDVSEEKPADRKEKDVIETESPASKLPSSENPKEKTEETSDNSAEPACASGNQPTESNSGSGGWFSSWGVSNITKMVESTSKTLVHGGLDVLETLGKKTFDVINERDPGLKKTRGFLHDRGDKPNLSAMLRDAKEQNEIRARQEEETEEARKAHFGSLFDDFQGLAHLEALEILSNQSEKKVNTLLNALPPEAISCVKPQLLEIKQNFEIGDEDDEDVDEHEFVQLIIDLMKQMNVGTTPDKLNKTHEKIRDNLKQFSDSEGEETKPQPKDIHQVAIQSLAELTSKSMEQFHKSGELLLLQRAENADYVSNSKQLLSLTKVLCAEVGILSIKFTECLNKCADGEDISVVNPLVTNVYLEASNSSSYIQDGFQLLLPVLQQAAIEKSQDTES